MAVDVKKEIGLEIAHVLFIDIVSYSKLSINEQQAAVNELTQIVKATEQFQKAEASDRLIKIATGDGIALVFYASPEAPVRCAIELSRAVKDHPRLRLRTGIHSGPVSGVVDVTNRTNLAGAGLNLAQRVMNCGNAGHILLSKHVAVDLAEFDEWRPFLHELGECKVKHGTEVSVVNLYGNDFGNPQLPAVFQHIKRRRSQQRRMVFAAALIFGALLIAGGIWFSRARPTALEKSIAILPFDNLSHDPENAFFADAVQDEILTDLARVADLKVISRSSVMHYKSGVERNLRKIGQELGVMHVLEGNVQRANNRVRVNAQLIDTRNDAHLWAQTFDRDLADVFVIQSEIAKAIADQLQAKLSPEEKADIERKPTENLKAYDLYTEAKRLLTVWIGSKDSKESITRAITLLDQATKQDPSFAVAYCYAATAHIYMHFFNVDRTPTQLTAAKQAVDRAVQLGPDLGETHLALAFYDHFVLHDFDAARREAQQAILKIPNDAGAVLELAFIDRRQGRWEQALSEMRKANALDPRNIEGIRAIADTLLFMRQYREALGFLDRQLALVPESAALVYMEMAECQLHAGNLKEAKQALAKMPSDYDPNGFGKYYRYHAALLSRDTARAQEILAGAIPGKLPVSPVPQFFPPPAWFRGEIAMASHDDSTAKAAFAETQRDLMTIFGNNANDPFQLAVMSRVDAVLGRKAEAISEGKRATELRSTSSDALAGPWLMISLAAVYGWSGEHEQAIRLIEQLSKAPCELSYGELKFNPWWDELRGDPRFEKIVASLAPKQ